MTRDPGVFERRLGRVLGLGAAVSLIVLAAGLMLALTSVQPVAADRLLRTGLYILMGTPVMRVGLSAYEYAVARDWAFLAITLSVLAVLFASLLAAMRV